MVCLLDSGELGAQNNESKQRNAVFRITSCHQQAVFQKSRDFVSEDKDRILFLHIRKGASSDFMRVYEKKNPYEHVKKSISTRSYRMINENGGISHLI